MRRFDAVTGQLLSVRFLTKDIVDWRLRCPQPLPQAKPGQFVQVAVPGHSLRRPISICEVRGDCLRLVFQIRGSGTAALAELKEGDHIGLLGPLGNGFPVEEPGSVLLIGGGIGVPPLLGTARALGERASVLLGFRNREAVILEEDFRQAAGLVKIATDDGSYGAPGLVTDLADEIDCDAIFACGPLPMLRSAKALANGRGVPCFLSLEERMACGVGACLGCAVALQQDGEEPGFARVCRDGPVFDARRLAGL